MSLALRELPTRRSDLRMNPSGRSGHHVVKIPSSGEYFALGEHESFLLESLNGTQTAQSLRARFENRFQQSLTEDDLSQFIELARSYELLEATPANPSTIETAEASPAMALPLPATVEPRRRKRPSRTILYWHQSLFDPDRLLSAVEPRLGLLWTRWFVAGSMILVLASVIVAWANRVDLLNGYPRSLSVELVVLIWLTLCASTALHEFSHGLTCKHYGGEVREIGFLLLFFTPCFYCNVSDAWLFREKSKRLWVTFAGAYCDLVLWAGAVIVWRFTLQDSGINHVAWVLLSVCGFRIFFNFNPLIKLDGYYLMSDLLEIPNLRQRAWDAVTARLRRILWGAPRPQPVAREKLLLAYGVSSWIYSILLLSAVLFGFITFFGARWGLVGFAGAALFAIVVMRGMLSGLFAGEVRNMIGSRPIHIGLWLVAIGGAAAAMSFVEVSRNAGGQFLLRPAVRADLQAPLDGFLRDVELDEGSPVIRGQAIGRIDVRDLETQAQQKRSDITEATARLGKCKMELEYAIDDCKRADEMLSGNVISLVAHRDAGKRRRACDAEIEQATAKLARLNEELAYLESLRQRSVIASPVKGVITTPRLREKNGQFFEEGDVIGVVEDTSVLEAEVTISEEDFRLVRTGEHVEFRGRSLPFETIRGRVLRIAPSAKPGETHSSITVYCRLDQQPAELRAGMTGHARIICGKQKLGQYLLEKTLTFVRTEFWW